MTKTIRSLLLGTVAAATLLGSGAAAAAESYDTTDDSLVVAFDGSAVTPGSDIDVTSTGWDDGSIVNVNLYSDPVFLGTLTANSVGSVTGTLSIPAGTEPGDHHIELSGTDPTGSPRVLSYAITISSTDGSSGATPDSLSFTGGSALTMTGAAGVLAGLGVSALRFRRRRLGAAA